MDDVTRMNDERWGMMKKKARNEKKRKMSQIGECGEGDEGKALNVIV